MQGAGILRLADQLAGDDEERRLAGEGRARLLAIRDGMLEKAKQAEGGEERLAALKEIVDLFGPFWGKDALDLMKGR